MFLGTGRLFHAATGIDADRADQPSVSRAARVAATFHLVAGCFVMFRAVDFATASVYFARLVRVESGFNGVSPLSHAVLALAMVIELTPRHWFSALVDVYSRTPAIAQGGLIAASLLLFSILGDAGTPFNYFQF
ncbi:MAG: hypothetical protein Q7R41_15695 [Phycisphaerales bacterium]|nr:hypothetical protein [Phycisphaerales bacterium]